MKTILAILILSISHILVYGQENRLYEFRDENGKYGFMDKTGKIRVAAKYLRVNEFSEGLAFVSEEVISKGYKWICIDNSGNKVFDIADNFPETNFNNGFARISSFTEHWFIDKRGKNVFKKTWRDGYQNFQNGIAYVSDVQFSDFYPIDTNGNRIGTQTYSRLEIFNKTKGQQIAIEAELIPFKSNNLFGFKNKKGETVIQPQFDKVGQFEKGICPVKINSSYPEFQGLTYTALIDTTGRIILSVDMYCYQGFKGDLIEYYSGFHFSGGPNYIDSSGRKIVPRK